MGVGFTPAGFVPGVSAAGIIELVAGTIAPPVPVASPVGLSIASETTADNLYFQASARVMATNPNRLISLTKQPLSGTAQTAFYSRRGATQSCYDTWCFYLECNYSRYVCMYVCMYVCIYILFINLSNYLFIYLFYFLLFIYLLYVCMHVCM